MKIKRLPKIKLTLCPDFANIIKMARLECGLSQLELAQRIGFKTATAINLLEKGKREINAKTLFAIIDITNYPIWGFNEEAKDKEIILAKGEFEFCTVDNAIYINDEYLGDIVEKIVEDNNLDGKTIIIKAEILNETRKITKI